MTVREHQLIICVVARQAMLIKALTDALVSHGVLAQDDVPAFGAFLDSEPGVPVAMIERTEALYKSCAGVLGLETGL
jgi:hypothetical protein